MDVNLVVVFLAVVARYETFVPEWVATHNACCNGLVNLVIEFLDATNAFFFTVLAAPDGQWGTPVAAAAQVPVI